MTFRLPIILAFAAVSYTVTAVELPAQAWAYPSFQPSRVLTREYNFGVADTDRGGSVIVFQWREQSGPRTQFSFDIGLADSDRRNADLIAFGGIGIGYRLGSATQEVPLDFLFTGGLYLAVGDGSFFRLPIGLSIGHRFDLDGTSALTPYVHPRLSLDTCNNCGGSNVGLTFDLGLAFEVTRTVAIRGAAVFAGDNTFDGEGFGLSIAWTPPSLARIRR